MSHLTDSPEMSTPIASETVAVLPTNQNDIEGSSAAGMQIDMYVAPHLSHVLMSQSPLCCTASVRGRGQPVFGPSNGFHAAIQDLRVFSGDGSTTLDETLGYNTWVSSLYLATEGDSVNNERALFEGYQANESNEQNLWYGNSATWYGGDGISSPDVSKDVQIVTPLHTHLLQSDSFLPVSLLQGLRLQFILAPMERSLRYLTGSLGVDPANAVPTTLNIPVNNTQFNVAGSLIPQLEITAGGTGYTNGAAEYLRWAVVGANPASGAVGVLKCTVAGGIVTAAEIWSTGSVQGATPVNARCLQPGDEIELAAPGGGTAAKFKVPGGVNPCGYMRKANDFSIFEFRVSADASQVGNVGHFGAGTISDPIRGVPQFNTAAATPFPASKSIYSIGDRLEISDRAGGEVKSLGLIVGIRVRDNYYTLQVCPNVAHSPDNGSADNKVLDKGYSLISGVGTAADAYNGIQLYVNNTDRVNGWTGSTALPTDAYPEAQSASGVVVGYTIKDWRMNIKRCFLPPADFQAEQRAAQSAQGYNLDIAALSCSQANLAKIPGPTSTMVTLASSLTRANGTLGIPLSQDHQFDYKYDAFVGVADFANKYQWMVGTDGVAPQRQVPIAKYSLANPVACQIQHAQEWVKFWEAAGYEPSSLARLSSNFSIARAYSQRNMYMNLMALGDVSLNIEYSNSTTQTKLLQFYTAHQKRVQINRDGITVSS